jgi:hypothetical protein
MGILDDLPYDPHDPSHPRIRELTKTLSVTFYEKGVVQPIVARAGLGLAEFAWDQPMAAVWPKVLAAAATSHLVRELVESALEDASDLELLASLIAEAPAADLPAPGGGQNGAGAAAEWDSALVLKKVALIDRADLRRHVRSMIDPDGERVLYVVGERRSGKSHTYLYLDYLSRRGLMPRPRIIDASARAGAPMSVQELAQQVASALVGRDAPTFDLVAQEQSVVTQFRGWLSGVSDAFANQPMWLVFDGFTAETATAAAMQLVRDLALEAGEYHYGELRITVCGFDDPTPTSPGALREPLKHPSDDDVKKFFARMCTAIEGVEPEAAAVTALFDKFVAREGAVQGRGNAELGPSALSFVRDVYKVET